MVINITRPLSELIEEIFSKSIEARKVLEKHVHKTPLITNHTLNMITEKSIYLKLENMQKTGAFKVRGAVYKVSKLIASSSVKGVVAASSGNHAQGVAYAAKVLGIEAYIVMPRTASVTKVNATKSYDAKIILYGNYYDEAYEKAMELVKEKNFPFIHPYDDPDIIAGQGTIAHEIMEDLPETKCIIAPIGGGGLISGLAVVAKKLNKDVKVIGVEPRNASSMYYRVKQGLHEVEVKPSIADAVVVKKPGDITSRIVEELVDDIVLVDEEDIVHAIAFLLERVKIVAEGAGALPVAALLSGAIKECNDPVVAVISGGNIDPLLLSRVIVHEEAREGRIVSLVGEVYDKPGELSRIAQILAKYDLNIVDVKHDRWDPKILPNKAALEVVVEAKSRESIENALRELKNIGYAFKLKTP